MHENAKEDQSMKYPWIDEYLMAKRGVTKDLQEEWNWNRYHIGGKCLPLFSWMITTSLTIST